MVVSQCSMPQTVVEVEVDCIGIVTRPTYPGVVDCMVSAEELDVLSLCEHASCYARANLPRTVPKSYWSWLVANHKGSIPTFTVVSPNTKGVHVPQHLYACLIKTEVPD